MTTADECQHVMEIESVTEPEPRTNRRIVHEVCSKCGYTVDVLTIATDEEIAEEVVAQEKAQQEPA